MRNRTKTREKKEGTIKGESGERDVKLKSGERAHCEYIYYGIDS